MKQLLVIALLALPLTALAGPKEKAKAQKHMEKAQEAHQAGNYEGALGELQAAYAADPQPDLLYAIGQVYVKLGKCEDAIASYDKFLATNPPADAAGLANEAITACKAQLAPPPPPPEPTPPPAPAPPPEPESRPFYADKIGTALVGGGVVSSVVGIVLYASARSTLSDAEEAPTYSVQQDLVDDAHFKRNLGLVFGAVGVAAIGVGVWHYMKSSSEPSVAVTPTSSGGTISWMGQF